MIRAAIAGAALLALAGCGVIYTAPDVNGGEPFGTAYGTDFDVRVIRLTHETAEAANLEPYVPPRLPAAFQPDAVASMTELDIALPSLPPLPGSTASPRPDIPGEEISDLAPLPEHSARQVSRPDVRRGELPPPAEPQSYRIGVGDVLVLALRDVATLEELPGLITAQSRRQGYVVQDDGAIGIPDAGRVRVSGLTLQEAESAIFDALVAAGIEPAFSLEINEFNSKHVAVGGLVGAPTVIPITLQPMRLDEAIQLAGGLRAEDPTTSTVQIFRDGTIYEITVDRYIEDPAARNVLLRDGDSVFVGTEFREAEAQRYFEEQMSLRSQQLQDAQLQLEREQLRRNEAQRYFDEQLALRGEAVRSTEYQIQIEQLREARAARAQQRLADERAVFKDRLEMGAVDRPYAYRAGEVTVPGRFALPFEGTANLADVLFDDRGIDIQTGDYGEIYVLRSAADPEKFGSMTAYHLDAENAVNLAVAARFEMHPNDVVFVSEQPVTSWNRVVSQILPQLFLQASRELSGGV